MSKHGTIVLRDKDLGLISRYPDVKTKVDEVGNTEISKIDQSFWRDVLTTPNDAARYARTVVALATNLGLQVIAEGVETQGQRDFLYANGCLNYQGYFFSRPLPIDQFESFVLHSQYV